MPLFTIDQDSSVLHLQEDTLQQVLLSDQLRDSPVIPITITGPFRRGKSFLLNVLLRYLRAESAGGGGGDWLAAEDAPLAGFPWRGGRQAHTRDLQLWSQPLPVTLADGRPAHVLLIDSQGAFDDVSTPAESVSVRTLAGLLSAVHVLNISRQPQSDDLQQARLCAEYGRLLASAAGASSRTPRLVMLVRDWAFPGDHPYGADGGRHVLTDWLAGGEVEDGTEGGDGGTTVTSGADLAAEELECFLLPHPGTVAAGGGPQFSGAVSQLSEEFADQLRRLAAWLLDAARLPLREVDGRPMTGASLAELCRSLATHTAELPPELAAAADHLTAAAVRRATEAALSTYTDRLQAATASGEPLSDAELQTAHQEAEEEAHRVMTSFPGTESLRGQQTAHPLTAALQEHWERVKSLNAERQRLRAAEADSRNAALGEAGYRLYEAAMERALPADGPSVTDACLQEQHTAAVSTALQHFDSGREAAGPSAAEQRSGLQSRLETQLTAHLTRNGALRQREAAAAAREAAERAVRQAQALYQQQMASAGELAEPALRQAHQAAAAAAEAAAGEAGQAQLAGWLTTQLEQQLEAARQREKAQAQAQLQAVQPAPAAPVASPAGGGHRRLHIRIGRRKIRIR